MIVYKAIFKKPFDFVFRLQLVLPELMANGEQLANGSTHPEALNVSSELLKSGHNVCKTV
jgi:hypothetical protein